MGAVLLLLSSIGCARKPPSATTPPAPTVAAAKPTLANCDQSLWAHVYHPTRLVVQNPCVTVTGVIVDATNGKRKDGVRQEDDGDTHGWLKLDSGQTAFLNDGNRNAEGGNLVFEIVCMFKVKTPDDAKIACKAPFKNKVVLPPVGSHVAITGSWVQDENHDKWFEIHPVTSIVIR